MPVELPQNSPDLITHVPSADELAQQLYGVEAQADENTYSRTAFKASLQGEQGTAIELNAKYPVEASYVAPAPKTSEAVQLPQPRERTIDDDVISREDLNAILADLRKEGNIQ